MKADGKRAKLIKLLYQSHQLSIEDGVNSTIEIQVFSSLSVLLEFDKVFNSVIHLLNSFVFSQSKTSTVGNVVDSRAGVGVFSVDTTDLQFQSITDVLEVRLGRDLRELDVDRSTDSGSQVGGAEGEPSETLVTSEWDLGFDGLDTLNKTFQNLSNVSTVLHGDDTEVIFFVDPDEESLGFVVVDTTSVGPVTAGVSGLEEAISFLEEEVILNKLVLDFLGHSLEWVVSTGELSFGELIEDTLNLSFHLEVVGLSQARVELVSLKGTSATNTSGLDEFSFWVKIGEVVGLALSKIGSWLLVVGSETIVVFLDDGIEERLEQSVRFSIRSIDTDTRIEVGNSGLDDIQQSSSKLGLLVLELINNFFGQVLLQQGVAVLGGLKLFIAFFNLLNNVGRSHLESQ